MDPIKLHKINQCILRIKSDGGAPAIEDLYGLLSNRLRVVALRYFHTAPDVDDAVQDFWANVVPICKKYRLLKNGYSYLLTCFGNICKSKLRSDHRPTGKLSVEDIDLMESVLKSRDDLSERQTMLLLTFEKARKTMNKEEQAVFALMVHGDMSVRMIAEELSLSKSEAGRLAKRVTEKLKIILIEEGWDKNER